MLNLTSNLTNDGNDIALCKRHFDEVINVCKDMVQLTYAIVYEVVRLASINNTQQLNRMPCLKVCNIDVAMSILNDCVCADLSKSVE